MRLYNTVNEITSEIGALYKNLTGKFPLSAVETDIVYGSIVDAMQIVMTEYGVDTFKFLESSQTAATVANQAYVDLSGYIYRVATGTVRIVSKGQFLSLVDEAYIFQIDPEATETGVPTHYAVVSSGAVNTFRIGLWPIPDAVYTLTMNVLTYPEDTITSFPAALNSAIKLKAKGMACLALGIGAVKSGFDQAYEDIMAKLKDGYANDGPRHIGRRMTISTERSIEGRIAT